MYEDIRNELTDLKSQLKVLVWTDKAATKEGQWSKRAEPRFMERKVPQKRNSAIVKFEPKQVELKSD